MNLGLGSRLGFDEQGRPFIDVPISRWGGDLVGNDESELFLILVAPYKEACPDGKTIRWRFRPTTALLGLDSA